MHIGLRIKELMSKEKIDAPTLAKKLGKSKQALYYILDKEDLNTALLKQLAEIFKVDIRTFFDGDAPHGHNQVNGDGAHGNINGNSNVVSTGDTAVLEERVKSLEAQLKAKDTLISEKERLIKIYEKMMDK